VLNPLLDAAEAGGGTAKSTRKLMDAIGLPSLSTASSMRMESVTVNPMHPASKQISASVRLMRKRTLQTKKPKSTERCQCLSLSEEAVGIRLTLWDKVFVSCVITLFVVHQTCSQASLQLLTCTTVAKAIPDGALASTLPFPVDAVRHAILPPGCPAGFPSRRLSGDLELCCHDGAVLSYMYAFGAPGLVVYAIGIPFVAAWLLTVYRNRLDEPRVRATLGFLFAGYRRSAYYWEAVVMLRKVAVAAIAVFLAPQGVTVQTYAAIFLVFLLALAQAMKRPFASRRLNRLELTALVASFVTFEAGLFLSTDESTDAVRVIATMAIFVANIAFLVAVVLVVGRTMCKRQVRRRRRRVNTRPKLRVLDGTRHGDSIRRNASSQTLLAGRKNFQPQRSHRTLDPYASVRSIMDEQTARS
jgi:hypothetical protein